MTSDDVRRLNPQVYGDPDKALERAAVKAEKGLQAMCENWLTLRGYERLTADNAENRANSGRPVRGWFAHQVNCRKNPLRPDLDIYDQTQSRHIGIELKVRDEYQPGQRELIQIGVWHEARSLEKVMELVKEWENRK